MENEDFKFDEKASALAVKAIAGEAQNEQNEEFSQQKSEDKAPVLQKQSKNKDKRTHEECMCGKFKNPEELLKAYLELEKEFTKKSQRLKELEASLRPYESEEEWREAADKFFEKTPSAKALAKDIAGEIALDPTLKQGRDCFDKALVRVLAKVCKTPEQLMSDGQFLKDYVLNSQEVREAVIGGYLQGIADALPPHTLSGGGQSLAAPLLKPRTVREAGSMLLRENR